MNNIMLPYHMLIQHDPIALQPWVIYKEGDIKNPFINHYGAVFTDTPIEFVVCFIPSDEVDKYKEYVRIHNENLLLGISDEEYNNSVLLNRAIMS